MQSLIATAVAAVLAVVALPAAPSPDAVAARSADSFVDSIGVNIHTVGETPYREHFEQIEQRLGELGVRHVRDELYPGEPSQYTDLNRLAGDGIGVTTILGAPAQGGAKLEAMVALLKDELAGSIEAVEGPNEFSTEGSPDWSSELAAYQQQLYEDVKGDPALASLPVIGPSLVHNDQAQLGDVSAWLDFGNLHSYPEGNGPEYRMGLNVERAELNSGAKPIVATETGYTTAVGWDPAGPGENRPVSEAAMATYMPRLFFEYFSRHIARTYSYELIDQRPDPEHTDREANFGLLRNDFSKKPAFLALANTIAILEDPGPAFTPGSLDYTLSGETADLHRVLLQKRDGTFYLALWRTLSVRDPVAKEALEAPSEPVTLELPQPGIGSALEYLPNASASPIRTIPEPSAVTVDVGPAIVLIALTPEAAEPQPPVAQPQAAAAPAAEAETPSVARHERRNRPRIAVVVTRRGAHAVVLRGRVRPAPGRRRPIAVQGWSGRWRTVHRGGAAANGSFRQRLRLPPGRDASIVVLRVVSGDARPSRTVRVRPQR